VLRPLRTGIGGLCRHVRSPARSTLPLRQAGAWWG